MSWLVIHFIDYSLVFFLGVFFFFQAEGGIVVGPVDGVQSWALPIFWFFFFFFLFFFPLNHAASEKPVTFLPGGLKWRWIKRASVRERV